MYERFGYSVYRRVMSYYHSGGRSGGKHDDEDAFGMNPFFEKNILVMVDMRKAMKRDKLKQSVRENGANFHVMPEDVVF